MTLGTERCLRGPGKLILRTERHGCVAYLQQIGRAYDTLDPLYDQYEDFDALNQAIAEHLWKAAANDPVIYAVMDASCDASVACLMQQAPAGGQVTVLPAYVRHRRVWQPFQRSCRTPVKVCVRFLHWR